MTHGDGGWRPTGAVESYKGLDVWDHDIGPHQFNPGQRDPEWTDHEGREEPTELDD